MSNVSKSSGELENIKMPKVKVSKEVGSHAGPFLCKKTEAAKVFLDRHGLPKELSAKK